MKQYMVSTHLTVLESLGCPLNYASVINHIFSNIKKHFDESAYYIHIVSLPRSKSICMRAGSAVNSLIC